MSAGILPPCRYCKYSKYDELCPSVDSFECKRVFDVNEITGRKRYHLCVYVRNKEGVCQFEPSLSFRICNFFRREK